MKADLIGLLIKKLDYQSVDRWRDSLHPKSVREVMVERDLWFAQSVAKRTAGRA
jgi:hypothetical protein